MARKILVIGMPSAALHHQYIVNQLQESNALQSAKNYLQSSRKELKLILEPLVEYAFRLQEGTASQLTLVRFLKMLVV